MTNATQQIHNAPGSIFDGAEVIYEYIAEQAVVDGLLYDARKIQGEDRRDEAGKIFREQFNDQPVYLTAALHRLIERSVANRGTCNDWPGVCWDIVWMARPGVMKAHGEAVEFGSGSGNFSVIITGCGRKRYQYLTVTLDGNGLTFSIQGED